MKTHEQDAWRDEIAAIEQEANEAFLRRDLSRLDELFSDALLVNSPFNRVTDKRKVLELLGGGVIGHVSSSYEHEIIRKDGDLVIVMGSDTVRDTESAPLIHRRITNIWRRESGTWRLYLRQATILNPPQGKAG